MKKNKKRNKKRTNSIIIILILLIIIICVICFYLFKKSTNFSTKKEVIEYLENTYINGTFEIEDSGNIILKKDKTICLRNLKGKEYKIKNLESGVTFTVKDIKSSTKGDCRLMSSNDLVFQVLKKYINKDIDKYISKYSSEGRNLLTIDLADFESNKEASKLLFEFYSDYEEAIDDYPFNTNMVSLSLYVLKNNKVTSYNEKLYSSFVKPELSEIEELLEGIEVRNYDFAID